jgi:fluoroquinolone transport system ATP-binding protein
MSMVTVRDLTFTYSGAAAPAVRRASFDIERGEIFGFLGPSGAGKSTTQKILIGLLRDYLGEIQVMGRSLDAWRSDYYERIGVSFEAPTHYLKLTGLENLTYFRALYSGATEEPETLLAWVGLADDGQMRVSSYSKGMRNRLSVARSLLNRPELLFLDEPTAGLDPVNARRVKEIVRRKQAEGATVFLTTHDMSLADELCDRVAFIVDGQIRLVDTPRALKLRYGQRLVRVEYGANGRLQSQTFPLDGLGENPAFVDVLRREQIETIHTQETTLENIFIEVTGRELM